MRPENETGKKRCSLATYFGERPGNSEEIDVKAIRAKLDMTQEEFAGRFGFSINTLRDWEQGRRVPEGLTISASSTAIPRRSRRR